MRKDILSFLFIVLYVAVLFYPVALGRIPFPADSLLGLYHPWRDVVWDGYTAGVPYRNFLTTDPMRQTYPWRELSIELWKSGEIPLWNPYSFTGTPLLANYQSAVLYPLNSIFLLGDFARMWAVLILLTPLLSLSFFYLWMRSQRIGSLASILGAVSYGFGGFMMGWMTWGTIGHVAAWLPLMLLAMNKWFARPQFRWLFIYLFASVSSLLAGHLQSALYVQAVTLLYGVVVVQNVRRVLLLLAIPILLASVQLLPTVEFLLQSARSQDITGLHGFLPYKHLVMFLIPDFFGNPAKLNYWGEWNYLEFNGYIGLIPLWLALIAARSVRTRLVAFAALCVGLSLLFATSKPLGQVFSFVQQAGASRLLLVTNFGLAVLAGLGMQELGKRTQRHFGAYGFLVGLFGLVGLFILFGFVTRAPWIQNLGVSLRNSVVPIALLILIGCIMLLRPKIPNRAVPTILAFLLVVTAFDLGRYFLTFTPFSPVSWMYPPTRVLAYLQADPEPFRIMATDRRLLPPNVSVAYRLASVEGYDPLYLSDYGRYIARNEQGRSDNLSLQFHRIITPQRIDIDLPNKLNAKYVLSLSPLNSDQFKQVVQEGETRLYHNTQALPRVDIDRGKARLIHYGANKVKVAVSSGEPATLVMRDPATFGWHAKVDNDEAPIQKIDGWFRAVNMPAGDHTVTFSYWPKGLTLGILGAVFGIVLLEVALWRKYL